MRLATVWRILEQGLWIVTGAFVGLALGVLLSGLAFPLVLGTLDALGVSAMFSDPFYWKGVYPLLGGGVGVWVGARIGARMGSLIQRSFSTRGASRSGRHRPDDG